MSAVVVADASQLPCVVDEPRKEQSIQGTGGPPGERSVVPGNRPSPFLDGRVEPSRPVPSRDDERAEKLPEREQDQLAAAIRAEIEVERAWEAQLAASGTALGALDPDEL